MLKLLKELFNPTSMKLDELSQMAMIGEFLSSTIDEFLDLLIEKNKLKRPSEEEVLKIKRKIIKKMQEKYPSAGIILKKEG